MFTFFSSYQGWDNPFRPEGELFHDAEEILRLWKEGKLRDIDILSKDSRSPEAELLLASGESPTGNDGTDSAVIANGNSSSSNKNGTTAASKSVVAEVTTHKVASSTKAEKADEVKKKKGCCSLM